MRQSDFFLNNKNKIIDLLNEGYNSAGIIEELEKCYPKEANLFGEESIVEIGLDNFNLKKFILKHKDCLDAQVQSELKRELKTKARKQQAMAKVLETREYITKDSILAEKKLLSKHRSLIEQSMLTTEMLEKALNDNDLGVDGSEFVIDINNEKNTPKEAKKDVLEEIIPISTIGMVREIIKRFGPLGYSTRQMADLADTSPEIFEDVIANVPELAHAIRISKHLLFENIGKQFYKAIMPGTTIKSKFTVARDIKDPEIVIGKLESFTTEGFRGNPDALFKLYKAMGVDLGLSMFDKDAGGNGAETGVLEVSPEKSVSEWEVENKEYQKNLEKREKEEL